MSNIEFNDPRAISANRIHSWLADGLFVAPELQQGVEPLVREIVMGVVRRKNQLDYFVDELTSKRPNNRLLSFLYVGLYQIFFTGGVPDHAAVHETVNAASRLHKKERGFINAVLRKAIRQRRELDYSLQSGPLPIRLAHPRALLSGWKGAYGEDKIEDLCNWNLSAPSAVIRLNLLAVTAEAWLAELESLGLDAERFEEGNDQLWFAPKGFSIAELPGFSEGWFYVQDPSTLHAPALLDAKPGEQVLDACASPGGKTCLLAEAMRGKGKLVAMDLHDDRLKTLRQNVERMNCDFVTVEQGDAGRIGSMQKLADRHGLFDAVLLDVPCSNTGVLRRRPEAKWRFSRKQVKRLNLVQSSILDSTGPLLKPGGRLVYSTCSIEAEENSEMIAMFLEKHPEFELVKEEALLPGDGGADGAYAALLIRRDN